MNLINPVELYAFANETNLHLTKFIEITKNIFILRSHIGINFSHTRSLVRTLKS